MPEHKELEKSISDLEEIQKHVRLSPSEARKIDQVIKIHPMRISPYYLSLINWNDPEDPIRKMAVPSEEELNLEGTYDTSGEARNT